MSPAGRLGPVTWTAVWVVACLLGLAWAGAGQPVPGLGLALVASVLFALHLLGEVRELRGGVEALQQRSGVAEGGPPKEVIARVGKRLSDAVTAAEAERDDLACRLGNTLDHAALSALVTRNKEQTVRLEMMTRDHQAMVEGRDQHHRGTGKKQ